MMLRTSTLNVLRSKTRRDRLAKVCLHGVEQLSAPANVLFGFSQKNYTQLFAALSVLKKMRGRPAKVWSDGVSLSGLFTYTGASIGEIFENATKSRKIFVAQFFLSKTNFQNESDNSRHF